mgnify:CR=1 FL=1
MRVSDREALLYCLVTYTKVYAPVKHTRTPQSAPSHTAQLIHTHCPSALTLVFIMNASIDTQRLLYSMHAIQGSVSRTRPFIFYTKSKHLIISRWDKRADCHATFASGMVCSQIFPGPVRIVLKSLHRQSSLFFRPFTCWISMETLVSKPST